MATIELDVRGLQAPEPRDRLLVKINCRPVPLFRILERNGYAHEEWPGADSLLEIAITKASAG